MNVRVARHFEVWIEEQVASGRFGDPNQVVEEALRLLAQPEAKLTDLRQAIQEGEASGPPSDLDFGALRQRLHQAWDDQQKGQVSCPLQVKPVAPLTFCKIPLRHLFLPQ